MRLDRVTIRNYKCFADSTFEFDPQFNLIAGENGSGKTSLLEAISHTAEPWLSDFGIPHSHSAHQIRLESPILRGQVVFRECFPLNIIAESSLPAVNAWALSATSTNEWMNGGSRAEVLTPGLESRAIIGFAQELSSTPSGEIETRSTVGFYRAGRAFQPEVSSDLSAIMASKPRQNWGYLNCLNPTTAAQDFSDWLGKQEVIKIQEGAEPAVYRTVKEAIIGCMPGATRVWFNARYAEPVVEWDHGKIVKFSNLSDGQRSIFTLVGDIARRMALLNPELGAEAPAKTPGIVLIDELDLHLHPRWQRRIVADLKRTFPLVQFFCTTHSPQIIGEVPRYQVIVLSQTGGHNPTVALGADSNWILEHVMDGAARSHEAEEAIAKIEGHLEDGNLEQARAGLAKLRAYMGAIDGEVTRLESTAYHLEALAHADD